jgi:YedE family putative selenium metabolism protein
MTRRVTVTPARLLAAAATGGLAAFLVARGNPGNMGLCGACFARDLGGALGLAREGPRIFRPEILGVVLGSMLAAGLERRGLGGRSGSYAVSRFLLGIWMAIGALVFLGCPFRLLQRLGGGDLNALAGALGLLAGVRLALVFEDRGYSVGRTQPAPAAVGLAGPTSLVLVLGVWLAGGLLLGPGPGEEGPPPHAPWLLALAAAGLAGALLQRTGFCAISACRQVFRGPRGQLAMAATLVLGYGLVLGIQGGLRIGFEGQPIAHSEHLWSGLSMALVGLSAAWAGGCPVRQMVMAGEGNGDAFGTVMGLVVGGALAHNLGLASSGAGTTSSGRAAVCLGMLLVLAYAAAISRAARRAAES